VFEELKESFGDAVVGRELQTGREAVLLRPEALAKAAAHLKGLGYDFLTDLGGADYTGYPGHQGPPLCVSYQLFGSTTRKRAWIKVYLPMDAPRVPSLCGLFACANWYERECYDLFGVEFEGHPHLKRLLLYEEFQGHPLRKDYPILKSQPLIPMRDPTDYEAELVRRRGGRA
jgi:NADH-quinone oxidoreductase subunit C